MRDDEDQAAAVAVNGGAWTYIPEGAAPGPGGTVGQVVTVPDPEGDPQ